MLASYRGRSVVTLGGDDGVGLSVAVALAGLGARVVVGRHPEAGEDADGRISLAFAAAGLAAPPVVARDFARARDVTRMMERVREENGGLDMLVAELPVPAAVGGIDGQSREGLLAAIEAGSWPLVECLHGIKRVFSVYPRHVVAVSSGLRPYRDAHGAYATVSRAVLETSARYMATHLREDGTLVNVVRVAQAASSSEDVIGAATRTVLALGSGRLDAMSGQVITVGDGDLGTEGART